MTALERVGGARTCSTSSEQNDRLRGLLALHFHPRIGSAYWLARQEALGWSVRDRVRNLEDLWLLGPTPPSELRTHSVLDFIPRADHGRLNRFVVGETAGTSGEPCAAAYRDDEFQAAFIRPFLRVAEATGFPRGEAWLWVGPSGPHLIGKAVRELARQTGSMDPFSVDFDPRWAKRLAEGSLARRRYLEHVVGQALDVLQRERVGVLFLTPPVLEALAQRLSDRQREAIHGVHYGGLPVSADSLNRFRELFPKAVHLAGYGNTLFGVLMETEDAPRRSVDYFPMDDRVQFHVAAWQAPTAWPPRLVEREGVGRVVFHRLDESCLLVGVPERDEAERIAPSAAAVALGCRADGLRDPHPPTRTAEALQPGLY